MRIALIEDNEALAKRIAYCLRDADHAVDLLSDGSDADVFLAQEGADQILPRLYDSIPQSNLKTELSHAA